MPKERNIQGVERLKETLAKSSVIILTDYRGLGTPELTTLRRKLRESGTEYHVVKNTLARIAAAEVGKKALAAGLEGPVAMAIGYGDLTTPARVITSYINETKSNLIVKGGLLGDKLITAQEVTLLATLPSREVLIARVIGQMKSPMARVVGALSSPISGLMGVLQQRIKQLEVK